MKKAPIPTADQSKGIRAANQNHGGPGAFSVPRPPVNYKEKFDFEDNKRKYFHGHCYRDKAD